MKNFFENYNAWKLIGTAFVLFVGITGMVTAIPVLLHFKTPLPGYWIAVGYIVPMTLTVWAILKLFGLKLFPDHSALSLREWVLIVAAYIPLLFTIEILTSFLPMPGDKMQFLVDLIVREPVWSFLVIVLAAPVLEELLFRRIILHFLLKKYKPLTAIILSSLAFALFHMNPWQAIGAFFMGMYFGYLYWRTRSLKTVIFLHFLTNLIGFWAIYTTRDLNSGLENVSVWQRLGWIVVFATVFSYVFRILDEKLRQLPYTVYFATNNPHKVEEIKQILPASVQVKTLKDLGFEGTLKETGNTLEENSYQKAAQIAYTYGVDVLADDTGLETEALDGAPGVYSARFAGPDASAEQNRALLLEKLKDATNRNARFRTVVTYIKGHEVHQFEGSVPGKIEREEKGEGGFGYDSVFTPEGYDRTFAELSAEEKNRISHRARALRKLKDQFENSTGEG